MADVFLQRCASGTVDEIDSMINENPTFLFSKDQRDLNGTLVAASNANWKVLIHLLLVHRISPHAIDSSGNNLFHHLVDGTIKSPPTEADLAELRQDLVNIWVKDFNDQLARLHTKQSTNQGTRPPTKILLKKPKELENEFFGNLKTFFPKFIMGRFHVVLSKKNNEDKTPSQYAIDLGELDLANLYESNSEYHPSRRRLIQGLNDSLIRLVGSYL